MGIPFLVELNLHKMWEWVYKKINMKHLKWQSHSLSFAGRLQVVQKVLSSHHIFYALAWLFLNSHVNMLERILQDFLWLDGKGVRRDIVLSGNGVVK